jgi:hypothetical protein
MVPFMGERRAILIALLFCFCLLVSTSGIVLASSGNWVEVTRFTGNEYTQTEPFTIEHVEWRIRWNFSTVFHMHQKSLGVFGINVFEKEPKRHVSSFVGVPTIGSENGTLSLSENGTFYLQIHVLNIYDYSILIEQNIDSIPEFPSWIIVPLFLVAPLLVIAIKKRSFMRS